MSCPVTLALRGAGTLDPPERLMCGADEPIIPWLAQYRLVWSTEEVFPLPQAGGVKA